MITYIPNFLSVPGEFFTRIKEGTPWVRVGNTPRSEYWCNDDSRPYTYGSGNGIRTYEAKSWTLPMLIVRELIESKHGVYLEGCFSNHYLDSSDHLGWHSDDDPGIDHDKPIAVVSLGAEREIYLRRNGNLPPENKILLGNGSLLLMPPGYQSTHEHKIPKASRMDIGPRISLTFRGLVQKQIDISVGNG